MPNPLTSDPWTPLRRHTPARIALGRAGGSLPTAELLAFAKDHAAARDAVRSELNFDALQQAVRPCGLAIVRLQTSVRDRQEYLLRPDLGRRLSEASRQSLEVLRGDALLTVAASSAANHAGPSRAGSGGAVHEPGREGTGVTPRGATVFGPSQSGSPSPADVALIVADGLSAMAAQTQAPPVVAALVPLLQASRLNLAPLSLVRFGRVAVQDEIGSILGVRLAVILLGERPGLGSSDSLGAYLVHAPRLGRTDAERNCVSNIRPTGLPPAAAAETLHYLIVESLRQHISGVALKDDRVLPRAGLPF